MNSVITASPERIRNILSLINTLYIKIIIKAKPLLPKLTTISIIEKTGKPNIDFV